MSELHEGGEWSRGQSVHRDDPVIVALRSDLTEARKDIAKLMTANTRFDREMFGFWDDEKREWAPGVAQQLRETLASTRRLERVGLRVLSWFGGIVTAVLIAILTIQTVNYFHLQNATIVVPSSDGVNEPLARPTNVPGARIPPSRM